MPVVLPQRPQAVSEQPQTEEERNSGSNWPEQTCRGTHVIRRKTKKTHQKKKKAVYNRDGGNMSSLCTTERRQKHGHPEWSTQRKVETF